MIVLKNFTDAPGKNERQEEEEEKEQETQGFWQQWWRRWSKKEREVEEGGRTVFF